MLRSRIAFNKFSNYISWSTCILLKTTLNCKHPLKSTSKEGMCTLFQKSQHASKQTRIVLFRLFNFTPKSARRTFYDVCKCMQIAEKVLRAFMVFVIFHALQNTLYAPIPPPSIKTQFAIHGKKPNKQHQSSLMSTFMADKHTAFSLFTGFMSLIFYDY